MTPPVGVRARFERFPATVKGAFILRGEDRDPHQVVLRGARVVPVGGGATRTVALLEATLDIVPKQDVFVPFETSVSELEPGWYDLECDLEVDGIPATFSGGRRFAVAWPRASTRRGQLRVDRDVRLAGGRVRMEQIDCAADSVKVQFKAAPGQAVTVRLAADGRPLHVLYLDRDEASGRGKVVAYPLLKTHRSLRIEVQAGRGDNGVLDITLP